MIPLRDDAPRSTTPYVTYFLIALNVAVFCFELAIDPHFFSTMSAQPSAQLWDFFATFGLVPANLSAGHSLGAVVLPFFTSMFVHASWLHLIFNMWFLWIFGDNVEDHVGHFRYLVLYLLCGLAGSGLHVLLSAGSAVPSLGASGAIAGIMGAYFVTFPSARVLTLVPFFFIYFVWLPAWLMLGYWFVLQFISGTANKIIASQDSGGVAFWAHVGGFLTGIALIKVFPQRARRYTYANWE
jgi:membrane associated rhomboid family serine protease